MPRIHWPRVCLPQLWGLYHYGDASLQRAAFHGRDRYATEMLLQADESWRGSQLLEVQAKLHLHQEQQEPEAPGAIQEQQDARVSNSYQN